MKRSGLVALWHSFSTGFLVAVSIPVLALAERPDWVSNYGRSASYPEQLYLTGFGMNKVSNDNDRAKSLQMAIESARSNLIQSIRVRLQSTVGTVKEERDQRISSYFSSVTQATSSLEIQGLDVKTYYDDDEEISYALACVSREKLAAVYGERGTRLRKEIRQRLDAGRLYEDQGMKTKALDEYLSSYPLFRQLEEAQAILLASKTMAMQALEDLEEDVSKDEVNVAAVREAVQRLIQKPLGSAEDLAWYIAYCLNEQLDVQDVTVLVAPPTYQDTRMASPFSRFFKQVLESKVSEVAKWTPVQQAAISQPRTRDLSREAAEASGAEYVLRGTYWEQPGAVKFITTLLCISDSKLVGSAETIVGDSVVQKTGLSLTPQNFAEAFSDQKQFAAGEVIGGGLSLEVWTNKGVEDLVFTKGERMQIYVRVNLPCHLRFLYHLADGSRTVLVDDYYIDESKVNQVYMIPEEFVCDEPFGAEFLQAFARTDSFEPMETVEQDGYKFLKEDLVQFLSSTRGMKKAKQGTLQAETRIVVTTLEK